MWPQNNKYKHMKREIKLSELEQMELLKQEKKLKLELINIRSNKPNIYYEKNLIEKNSTKIKGELDRQNFLLKNQANILDKLADNNPKLNKTEKQILKKYNQKPKITNIYNLFQSKENQKEHLQKNIRKEISIFGKGIRELEVKNTKLTNSIKPVEEKYRFKIDDKYNQLQNIRKAKEKYPLIDYEFKNSLSKKDISEIKGIQEQIKNKLKKDPLKNSKIKLEEDLAKSKRILIRSDNETDRGLDKDKIKGIIQTVF